MLKATNNPALKTAEEYADEASQTAYQIAFTMSDLAEQYASGELDSETYWLNYCDLLQKLADTAHKAMGAEIVAKGGGN